MLARGLLPVCALLVCATALHVDPDDVWEPIHCHQEYYPEDCDISQYAIRRVEDYERCAPARLRLPVRNYYLGTAGRGATLRNNRKAFSKIDIRPKMMVDTTKNTLKTTILGKYPVSMPIGLAPSAMHRLAHPDGERATAAAAASMDTVMILSSFSTIPLEEVADVVRSSGSKTQLWQQIYIFKNLTDTVGLVRRAEKSGYKAIVLTVDSNVIPQVTCDAKHDQEIKSTMLANLDVPLSTGAAFKVITYKDISWLKSITNLPVVVKGILSRDDAKKALTAGADAIFVSNHGGRQMDSTPASIDALSEVVDVAKNFRPQPDVYLDGGVRNGWDIFKAIKRGAKMVFVGRPVLWGLTMNGENGVKDVLNILKTEFNETMLLAGYSSPDELSKEAWQKKEPLKIGYRR